MKLDILVIAAHPDDAELGCAGSILKQISLGNKVGILDLTKGELGTRGSAHLRMQESEEASKKLGIQMRENLGFRDGFFLNDESHQLRIIEVLRKYQPEIVLANAVFDRHPDHAKGSSLISMSCFYSGLRRISTKLDGIDQDAWRPKAVYHYIQDYYIKPDFVLDISEFMEKKLEVIRSFKSQFYDPNSDEPQTVLTNPDFMEQVKGRAREYGRVAGFKFAEGYTVQRLIGVNDLFKLI